MTSESAGAGLSFIIGTHNAGEFLEVGARVLARDAGGNIACAVSTSGTALKFPGGLGDSLIVGAGNYCDDRYGAPACTGRGELAIRTSTARTVIHALEFGLSVVDAATHAMRDVHEPDGWAA